MDKNINFLKSLPATERMPVLFVGHGSPMNAIEQNEYSLTWQLLGKSMPKPAAILCVSAHWETAGTYLTAMQNPKTIHDFGGFPRELYNIQYPANGNPELAEMLKNTVKSQKIGLDTVDWGFDHGSWSVLRHFYPEANIPLIQMSLNRNLSPAEHFELGKELIFLRHHGVLIVGSGNVVHNLRMVDWYHPDAAFDWATETNESVKQLIQGGNGKDLTQFAAMGTSFKYSIPTSEHFLPLLYILSARHEADSVSFFNDKIMMGSLSMTGVLLA